MKAITDGRMNRDAMRQSCPICKVEPGERCVIDPTARPYPSTIKVGTGDRYHLARDPRRQ